MTNKIPEIKELSKQQRIDKLLDTARAARKAELERLKAKGWTDYKASGN